MNMAAVTGAAILFVGFAILLFTAVVKAMVRIDMKYGD